MSKTLIHVAAISSLVGLAMASPAFAGAASSDGMWQFADAVPEAHQRAEA